MAINIGGAYAYGSNSIWGSAFDQTGTDNTVQNQQGNVSQASSDAADPLKNDKEKDEPGKKPGYKSSPAECKTCRERKYKDGSDENVSFKSASHISPNAAGAAVRAHEGEHVSNAYTKAAQKGGKVLSVGVSIHTAVCPECGRVYVSGGETRSAIAYPADNGQSQAVSNPYAQNKKAVNGILNEGLHADMSA